MKKKFEINSIWDLRNYHCLNTLSGHDESVNNNNNLSLSFPMDNEEALTHNRVSLVLSLLIHWLFLRSPIFNLRLMNKISSVHGNRFRIYICSKAYLDKIMVRMFIEQNKKKL
ncbi:hypothetical protein BpHYR1_033928 [Brachionus plicatilis]|uniref:Uncharacterized protein n=1 Tax=Brachionus plicatilis TaxID=10195 RepID=A0A3M7QP16_BRAPC|nr:hypothetical protein BpHYR1_033928 [Brachionus plicatilis]